MNNNQILRSQATIGSTAVAPKPVGEIQSLVEEINKNLSGLEHELDQLAAKLSPVVLPYPATPSGNPGQVAEQAYSPIGSELNLFVRRLNDLNRNISQLHDSIRL